jgi:ElaB/YqjD/DUF883 family membrane-anchored ribosome-binding protein
MDAKVDTLYKDVTRIVADTNISIDSLRGYLDESAEKIRVSINNKENEIKQTFETKSDGLCLQLQKEIEASGFLLEQMIEQL